MLLCCFKKEQRPHSAGPSKKRGQQNVDHSSEADDIYFTNKKKGSINSSSSNSKLFLKQEGSVLHREERRNLKKQISQEEVRVINVSSLNASAFSNGGRNGPSKAKAKSQGQLPYIDSSSESSPSKKTPTTANPHQSGAGSKKLKASSTVGVENLTSATSTAGVTSSSGYNSFSASSNSRHFKKLSSISSSAATSTTQQNELLQAASVPNVRPLGVLHDHGEVLPPPPPTPPGEHEKASTRRFSALSSSGGTQRLSISSSLASPDNSISTSPQRLNESSDFPLKMKRSSASYGIQQMLKNEIDLEEKAVEREKFEERLKSLKDETVKIYETKIGDLNSQHNQRIQELERNYRTALNNARNKHESEMKWEKSKHEHALESLKRNHGREVDVFKRQQEDSLREKLEAVKRVKAEYEEREAGWQTEKQEVFGEIQRLKDEANRFIRILSEDNYLSDEALSPGKRQTLQREVESLQLVVDMRTQEIHRLRDEQSIHLRQLEDLDSTKSQLEKAKAKIEDLQAQLDSKIAMEKQIALEKSLLETTYEKESKANARISMQIEELQWRIKNKMDPINYFENNNNNRNSIESSSLSPMSVASTPLSTSAPPSSVHHPQTVASVRPYQAHRLSSSGSEGLGGGGGSTSLSSMASSPANNNTWDSNMKETSPPVIDEEAEEIELISTQENLNSQQNNCQKINNFNNNNQEETEVEICEVKTTKNAEVILKVNHLHQSFSENQSSSSTDSSNSDLDGSSDSLEKCIGNDGKIKIKETTATQNVTDNNNATTNNNKPRPDKLIFSSLPSTPFKRGANVERSLNGEDVLDEDEVVRVKPSKSTVSSPADERMPSRISLSVGQTSV